MKPFYLISISHILDPKPLLGSQDNTITVCSGRFPFTGIVIFQVFKIFIRLAHRPLHVTRSIASALFSASGMRYGHHTTISTCVCLLLRTPSKSHSPFLIRSIHLQSSHKSSLTASCNGMTCTRGQFPRVAHFMRGLGCAVAAGKMRSPWC